MIATTSGLLRLAASERQLDPGEQARFDIRDLTDEVLQELNPSLAVSKISVKLDETVPVEISARREDIKIVLKNIIENAIQYSKEGGEIAIKTAREGAKVKVEIADTGIGISDSELPKIFDRFWRSDKARSHTSGGSGLGLSIVEAIVKRYKGSVSVKSLLGKGTTFTLLFP
jgi:signal transduction histidine kinase